ncbi:SigE family RNA polymerase sigma factor [Actinopolymorpha alba]|uniref:SigE family RNA polymerase sigma factor n=1 Tax=Actinopolymorpha alba TaxID=533267 RepID=UPI00036B277E|nr:SigE family RNA polymerase sigma factor [Actinopolymorpha alba]
MTSDPDDFVEFASARAPQLFRTAYLLAGDWHLAEDLVQTTFGKLYASWRRVRNAENPVAYAHTVLLRTFLSHRRRRSAWEAPSDNLPEQSASGVDPALRLTLIAALGQLAPRDRAIVVLRYWEDRSVEETATLLGLRSGVVRTQSMRALTRLRALLGSDVHDLAGC